jgi:hypothetical protein
LKREREESEGKKPEPREYKEDVSLYIPSKIELPKIESKSVEESSSSSEEEEELPAPVPAKRSTNGFPKVRLIIKLPIKIIKSEFLPATSRKTEIQLLIRI